MLKINLAWVYVFLKSVLSANIEACSTLTRQVLLILFYFFLKRNIAIEMTVLEKKLKRPNFQ